MKALAGVGVLVVIALAAAACAGSHKKTLGPEPTGLRSEIVTRTVKSSRLILGGRVRCTAIATTPVEAGREIAVTFLLHNDGAFPIKAPVADGSTSLVIKAADGTTYDTARAALLEHSLGGPYRTPLRIPAGATRRIAAPRVYVRWKGPLRIVPGCENKALPALPVDVTAAGPPPDKATAIADVVASTGGLLDHCRPQKSGVAVVGTIEPPSASGPSMDARCSVTLHSEGRFLVAQTLVLIPPGLRGVRVQQPYETLPPRKQRRPFAAIAWELVVTRNGAVTVAGFTHDATRAANRMAPEWTWSGSGWSRPGSARCGYEGFAGEPMLDLISVCP